MPPSPPTQCGNPSRLVRERGCRSLLVVTDAHSRRGAAVVNIAESVDSFVAHLAQERTGSLLNQYASDVDGIDRPGGAAIRCANLRAYLEPRIGASLALIGEAPSAHGGRFSGIAFTAERSLAAEQRTSASGLRPGGFTEHSATVLRRVIEAVGFVDTDIVLWNAVPFHPARADDALRNRTPSVNELALGRRWLLRFLDLMQPGRIVAVGRSAGRVLPPGTTVVRHPANGGSRQLLADLTAVAADLRLR
jgi:uracil-DNA glycosylase